MKFFSVIIILVILIGLGIGAYFIYNSSNEKIVVVEKEGEFKATYAGMGIGDFAVCPEGKEAISGGCSSVNAPTKFILTSQRLHKSRQENLDHYNAWYCEFSSTEAGTFLYSVQVNCK